MPDTYQNHKKELDDARAQDEERQQPGEAENKYKEAFEADKKRQKSTSAITPKGVFSAVKQIDLIGDIPFACALGGAILKDLLDFVFAPTVVLSILASILCSIFIFMMLVIARATEKRKVASRFIMKFFVIIGGSMADSFPGIDFLPIETITVFIIYYLVLHERANA
jgi:hypothetical protein